MTSEFDELQELILEDARKIYSEITIVFLNINNIPITLTAFPKQIIRNVLLAMASCLKGVGKVRNLQIFLKNG